ncbi:hypothetical protein LC55x_2949 [Lysobacter capsici]|nr:hypothetical protein LC55x_2949 [Lysobacter capsici]
MIARARLSAPRTSPAPGTPSPPAAPRPAPSGTSASRPTGRR